MTTTKIKVPGEFIDHRDMRARAFNKGEMIITREMRMRADCEIYEWHMIRENLWGDYPTWAGDGVSDKYGVVDVKIIEKWWNLPTMKTRHIFRQYGVVDHYYFLEKLQWPDGPLLENDTIELGFIGVMTFEEVAKRIEVSRGNGFYVDARKYTHV